MKRYGRFALRTQHVAVLAGLTCVLPAAAQTYEVTRYTIDGGGVMNATGGVYEASGTIGQADAGELTSATYTVRGGFWVPTADDCTVPDSLTLEASVPDIGNGTRVRHLSFTGGTPTASEAVRVELTASADFPGAVGMQWWVGPPQPVAEDSGTSGPGTPGFWPATLQCDPYFTDWSVYDSVHVYEQSIVPSATYAVDMVADGCEDSEANFSAALSITTSAWGDLTDQFGGGPDTAADFSDISAIVDKFKNLPGAAEKPRADIAGDPFATSGAPDQYVDFTDIPYAVDAFRSLPYPFAGPVSCE